MKYVSKHNIFRYLHIQKPGARKCGFAIHNISRKIVTLIKKNALLCAGHLV